MMPGERTESGMAWHNVRKILGDALDLPPPERAAFLERACAGDAALKRRVEALLAAEAKAEAMLGTPGVAPLSAVMAEDAESLLGSSLDGYRIIRLIGAGGMGMVYEAEQENPRRRVALKLLRAPLASREVGRRFEYEGLILARLQHPGIAQIFEAGVAEARVVAGGHAPATTRQPFLAIEYVDGPNLIDFANGRRTHGGDERGGGEQVNGIALNTRARLELFARVCDALQYAHQRGVIHRDLKPDNILVALGGDAESGDASAAPPPPIGGKTEIAGIGQPKILDFGVARVREADPDLTIAQTGPGQVVGTLAYMSPEQICGETRLVDTRSDLYSMGVMLYQLMSGRLPHDIRGASLRDAMRIVREEEPPAPHVEDAELRGDVQAIVATALEKDRDRRYQSAAEMAADIRRCLAGEPVLAKRNSALYIIRKVVRKHRMPLGVAALFLSVLVASSVIGWSLFVSAQSARKREKEVLRSSYVEQARAIRDRESIGRRFEALRVLGEAAKIRFTPDLRDEAIACMVQPDLLQEHVLESGALASAAGLAVVDRVAVAIGNGMVRVTRIDTGAATDFQGPDAPVVEMRFSRCGRFLRVVYLLDPGGGPLIVYDVEEAREAWRADGGPQYPWCTFGETNGTAWLALVQTPGLLRIVDLPSGQTRRTIRIPENVQRLAADPSGTKLAACGPGAKSLDIFDAAAGERLLSIPLNTDLRSPAWSHDGNIIAGGGSDFAVHLWDATTGEAIGKLEGHRSPAVTTFFAPDGVLVSAGWDGTSRVWDVAKRRALVPPIRGEEAVGFDGERLVLWTPRTLRIMRLVRTSPLNTVLARGPLGPMSAVDFTPDGRWMLMTGSSGVEIRDTQTNQSRTINERDARCGFIMREPSRLLAVVEGKLLAWPLDAQTGATAPAQVVWTGSPRLWAAPAPDGKNMILTDDDAVTLLDPASGRTRRLAGAHHGIERPGLTPDGRWLFTGTWRGDAARLLDAADGQTVLSFEHSSVRGSVCPTGNHVAVGIPGSFQLFRAGDWHAPRTLEWEPADVPLAGASAFSPDGRLLAACIAPHAVRLIDAATGATLAKLPNPDRLGVSELKFSPDGKLLAVVTIEREVFLWNLDELRKELRAMGFDW